MNEPPLLRVLLVDDEYLALNLLENYLNRKGGFEIVGKCKSGSEALAVLNNTPVDLLFLDIQMPHFTGLEVLRQLERPPATIFTTAYRQYAVDAFDHNAVDYLLKPFPYERFEQALSKAVRQLAGGESAQLPSTDMPVPTPSPDFMTIKADGKLVRVPLKDILYIEGMKEYVRVVCAKEKYMTFERLKVMEAQLPSEQFVRIHKSYLVARAHVRALDGNVLDVAGHRLPVSRAMRLAVVKAIFDR